MQLCKVLGDISNAGSLDSSIELGVGVLAIVVAVIIVLAMNLVGSLLISALVIFRALSAMRMFKSFRSVTVCAAALSVMCSLIGILASILAGTPVGSTIVAVQIIAFGLSWLAGTVLGGLRR